MRPLTLSFSSFWLLGGRPDDNRVGRTRHVPQNRQPADLSEPATHPDHAIAERLRHGDVTALAELTHSYAIALEAHAYAVVHADDLAQDVVQDVLVRLWEHRDRFELKGSWSAYLHRAVHFAAVSALRHEITERRVGAAYSSDSAFVTHNTGAGTIEHAELDRVVRAELDALPPRCREIFLLNRQGGLSYARIAELLHVAPQTVANQMHRALHRLSEAVRRWELGK